MSLPFQTVRMFSKRASTSPTSPKAFVMYGYIIAGLTLPFAIPASRRNSLDGAHTDKKELSLHHCCR
ncbi:uncharacterized protein LAJ45_04813 [Morchella importuna]|uniref:Uncharacterized protein n=1 Tax=Morchella conica CCBAS932 TaxID=1392247 RepID=A0A3N4KIN9_9PEZI|nr:uncharacterized protein LAJ45_04813 [Morchella importuna]KAH8151111.1 hypothetical protein LAJ45_04813 [Morchella importuna]RPB09209.1 hypothetical protein P167DRAFT_538677 [Morchella conica CCBAS932]